jgi:WD40 repeat protein
MGFKAPVIVWDYSSKTEICRLSLHKVAVQSVAFSPSGKYLATLGGSDDGTVVIWDMDPGRTRRNDLLY